MSHTALLLVINCGSSSLKFALYEADSFAILAEGLAESLSSEQSRISLDIRTERHQHKAPQLDHNAALTHIIKQLEQHWPLESCLAGIGHRVVHGGETFKASIRISATVIEEIKACIPLAPLHNPANLMGIELLQMFFPSKPQVAVFDTAFHQTMPDHAFVYGLPYALYRNHGVRRYGFHGTSHRFVAAEAANQLGKAKNDLNVVSAHLGNGASVCAVANGQSVDTSMGMTPLEGLIMGTRSGDIDPGLFDFLIAKSYSADAITTMLNKESGLLGISEQSNDMRQLVDAAQAGHAQAQLAIEVFCFRLAKYIAAMMVSLPQLDALIFTGGIGENAALVRQKTLEHLTILGFLCDETANSSAPRGQSLPIHPPGSHPVWIIPTDEERMIAIDTAAMIADD